MKIATGLAVGLKAEPELAAAAVLSGMSKGELDASACVLLFLSSEFASSPRISHQSGGQSLLLHQHYWLLGNWHFYRKRLGH